MGDAGQVTESAIRRERVLITGATGFLGRHLTEAFRRHGYEVVASARKVNNGVTANDWVLGDIENRDLQQAAVKGCTVVVNAAGRVKKGERSVKEHEWMFRSNCDMAVSLALAAEDAGVKRFMHISSTGVYGKRVSGLCDESTSCLPDNVYEKSKLAGEERLLAMRNGSMQLVIVRPSNVFGEMHPWNKLLTWMKAVKSGKAFLAGNPDNSFVNYVYVVDVAEAIVSLGESNLVVGGEVLNINTPQNMSEFYQATTKAVGVNCRARVIPKSVLVLIAALFDMASHITRWSFPITKGKVEELTGECVFSSERLKKLCPAFPSIGLEEGLARLAQHYRDRGLL